MCDCKDCQTAKLNPEPTDVQLASFKRHKAAGTSPGNPKWYKAPFIRPFLFVGGPPKYPHLPTGADWHTKNTFHHRPDPFEAAAKHDTTKEYVAAYDLASGFRPA